MTDTQVENIQKSVGKTLQDVRLSQEMSINEIVEQTRLDPKFIVALEKDDYDVLPSATYVRGYLRSYAKVLSLDADSIIEQYNEQAPEPPEIIPHVKHATQISSSDKPVKAFTYLVTFILVLLLLAWAQSRFIVKDEPMPPAIGFIQEAPPTQEGPDTAEPIIDNQTEGMDNIEFIESVLIDISDNETVIEVDDTVAPLPSDDITTEINVVPNDQVNIGDSLVVVAQDTVDAIPERDEEVVYTGPDSISIKLTADSWIEIYDAFDQKVYMDLGRSGEVLSLRGTAPFNVKLGFSQGVSLEFNGESIDPSPYSVAGVARFTLGE